MREHGLLHGIGYNNLLLRLAFVINGITHFVVLLFSKSLKQIVHFLAAWIALPNRLWEIN